MSAVIRSSIPSKPTVTGASRNDLAPGDSVTLTSLNPATTYNWDIVFVPQGSSATIIGSGVSVGFLVDLYGPYLVRLITDVGLMSEDTQYVRLRALTSPLGLRLVSAGERRDSSGVIPVDVDIEGWANDQNYNLLALESALGALDLQSVMSSGSVTGGNDLEVSTGDKITGTTQLELISNSGDLTLSSTGFGTGINLNPDPSGAVVVNGKLTVTGLIDPTGLVLTEQSSNPSPVSAGIGTFWVLDDAPTVPMFTDDTGVDWRLTLTSGTSPGIPTGAPLVYHLNLPDSPNDTVEYRGWVPYTCVLKSVRTYMSTINNQGNYTLDVVNRSTGNSCLLGGATFDMNALVVDTVTTVPLKSSGDADLDFSAAGRWTVYLASDDIAFNGQDIYVELVFEVV